MITEIYHASPARNPSFMQQRQDLEKDKNGHVFPVAGTITYDNDSVNQISINRRIAIHEMAYILGLVSVNSGFFDSATSTYKAKSHAGWAYGELLGTYRQTAIPMIGKEYWDYIDFPNEALNASAGPPNGLVSQMTIAALRDIGWNVNYGAADDYLLPVR
ncbi:MAG: hypothetical protein IGR76_02910 [Synechococcales cyanobacterium T60_A2020_003]|nr:hypothetical protein [Synechococcales cyanobacterium T60_A2020_003]